MIGTSSWKYPGWCGQVNDKITLKNYANLPRFGALPGKPNQHFLNADLFKKAFLSSFDRIQNKAGVFIFEFSHFYPKDFEHGRNFVVQLDDFFSQLPKNYSYAVEVRNKSLLQPEYFSMLRSHEVGHVFNSWIELPEVTDQIYNDIFGELTVVKFTTISEDQSIHRIGASSPPLLNS